MRRTPLFTLPVATGALVALLAAGPAQAAGTLKPASGGPDFQIRSHEANVVITNGFAAATVDQVFFNPGPAAEAIYIAPLPPEAALSEFTIQIEDRRLSGEVVRKAEAETIYREEKEAGREAGLGAKDGFRNFQFSVSVIPAGKEARVHYLYYQPIRLDEGVGRFVYPLERGGNDDGKAFWSGQSAVAGPFRFKARVDSAFPIDAVRAPDLAGANIVQVDPNRWTLDIAQANGQQLNRDIIFYYRLAEGAPGRLEVVPHRASAVGEGTFMATLTPGIDLAPLTGGADWTFLVDTSGSMQFNLTTVIAGLEEALKQLKPEDRFRLISFNTRAREVFAMSPAEPARVAEAIDRARGLTVGGGTNLFDALDMAFKDLDPARATGIVLITDGVTNAGSLTSRDFRSLLRSRDARVFGIVLGNEANWPLMDFLAKESEGFSLAVSNADDVAGRLAQAREKITHAAMRDIHVEIEGVATRDLTPENPGSLYHGQQLVVFGHYLQPGRGVFRVTGVVSGKDVKFEIPTELPSLDASDPEIERLWALARGEELTARMRVEGQDTETVEAIADLGQRFSIVNDFTAMIVLDDARHAERGVARNNQARIADETKAQSARAGQPAQNFAAGQTAPSGQPGQGAQVAQAVPTAPNFGLGARSHSIGGGGGGAIDPFTGGLTLLTLGAGALARRRRSAKAVI